MSKLIFVFLGLMCAMQSINARSVREAPAEATSPITIQDLVKQTDDALKSVQSTFLAFIGVKDADELGTVLKTQSKSIADKLQATSQMLLEEAKNSHASELLRGFTDKLTTQIDQLKRENPDIVLTAEQYKENFENGLKTVVAETQDFSTKLAAQGEGINENLQKLVKQIYDNTLEASKTAASQIEAAANKKQ